MAFGIDDAIVLVPLITAIARAAAEGRAATQAEIDAATARMNANAAQREALTAAIEADPAIADLVAARKPPRVQT